MKEFRGKVAVVTGAASGIGRALAEKFAAEGMKVVLADVQEDALAAVEADLRARGATVLGVRTDVSRADQVEALAQRTLDAFGAVHVLCNNAGVTVAGGPVWAATEADWHWVLGVNLFGVIHGIRAFVPIMLKQGTEGHIVNTASVAGLVPAPGLGPYSASKEAVVSISEGLQHDLIAAGSLLRASVLCPGFVATNIVRAARNRPTDTKAEPGGNALAIAQVFADKMHERLQRDGQRPEAVADLVFDAIQRERFYVYTNPEDLGRLRARMEGMLAGELPVTASVRSRRRSPKTGGQSPNGS